MRKQKKYNAADDSPSPAQDSSAPLPDPLESVVKEVLAEFDDNGTHRVSFDQEEDGRVIAEIESIPGALAYGATQAEAQSKVEAIAREIDGTHKVETIQELQNVAVGTRIVPQRTGCTHGFSNSKLCPQCRASR